MDISCVPGAQVYMLLCTDDPKWALAEWPPELWPRTFLVRGSSAREVDMSALAMLDHTVVSAGSFGWWAAYLREASFRDGLRNNASSLLTAQQSYVSWTPF